jgi:membrane protease subunit HflC
MKHKKSIIVGMLIFIGVILLSSSLYIVNEDEVAVVKVFSNMIAVVVENQDVNTVSKNLKNNKLEDIKIINEKGLHFKIPFIQTVEKYSSKYFTYTSNEELINTKDGRRIDIQMYAQYRVIDPVQFKMAVGNISNANRRLDDTVYPVVIQSANNLVFNEFFYKSKLEEMIKEKLTTLNDELVSSFGIYVSDVGINRKNFPPANIESIEKKMTMQIEKESEKLKAEGDSQYLKKKASTDRKKAELVSKAVEEAAVIKAQADAEAIKIYQDALNKDLNFYKFIKTMEIYKNLKDKTIFLDKNNDIFELVNGYK